LYNLDDDFIQVDFYTLFQKVALFSLVITVSFSQNYLKMNDISVMLQFVLFHLLT